MTVCLVAMTGCQTTTVLPDFPCPPRYAEEPIPQELVAQIPDEAKIIIIRNYEGYRENVELLEDMVCAD